MSVALSHPRSKETEGGVSGSVAFTATVYMPLQQSNYEWKRSKIDRQAYSRATSHQPAAAALDLIIGVAVTRNGDMGK